MKNGPQVFRSNFKPARSREVLCIGGPLGAMEYFVSNMGIKSSVKFLLHQMTYLSVYRPKLDYFPFKGKIPNFFDKDAKGLPMRKQMSSKMSRVFTVVLSSK